MGSGAPLLCTYHGAVEPSSIKQIIMLYKSTLILVCCRNILAYLLNFTYLFYSLTYFLCIKWCGHQLDTVTQNEFYNKCLTRKCLNLQRISIRCF